MKSMFLVTAGFALCFYLAPVPGNASAPRAFTIQDSSEKTQEAIKTFTGTVTKQGDIYILSDKADKTNYQLDDPKKVSEYEGKTVKVTGTLDAENLLIHVETITMVS